MDYNVKIVSYSGCYPNYCSGILVVDVDGKTYEFEQFAVRSEGSVWFDNSWTEHIDYGPLKVADDKFPDGFPEECKSKLNELLSTELEHGCCGGCI